MIVGLMVGPLLAAALVYLLRRFRTSSSLAAVLGLVIEGVLLLSLEPLPALSVFGRTFELELMTRYAMAWCAFCSALLELIAWRVRQTSDLAPLSFVTVTLVGVAFGFRIVSISALALQMVVLLAVVLVQSDVAGDTTGAQRMLNLTIAGLPALLVAGWLLDRATASPGQTVAWGTISLLITVGVASWAGCAPFQAWAGATGRTASPLGTAWVHAVWQPLVFILLMRLLTDHPELESRGGILTLLVALGVITLAAGAVLSLGRQPLGSLLGYTSLLGMGIALVVLGTGATRSASVALALLAGRGASALLAGAGLSWLMGEVPQLELVRLGGAGRRAPWATISAMLGALGLAGLPVGAAFGAFWAAYRFLADRVLWISLVSVGASALLGFGWWRVLARLTQPTAYPARRESLLLRVLLIALAIGGLALAFSPAPLLSAGQLMARAIDSFGR